MSHKDASPTFVRSYLLYAGTIFLSAFLLFVIQPIAGKHILPYFGGSSAVWATSLAFFTGMLFLGYLYVYVITSLSARRQAIIHLCVVALASAAMLLGLYNWHSLYPSFDWTIGSTRAPTLNVLLALALGIGAPYFLLSTTGPLLQYWWGMSARKEAYKLYALSNGGSLIALAAFPFLIEPNIPLPRGENIWAALFLIYALVFVAISVGHLRLKHTDESTDTTPVPPTPFSSWVLWIALSALPSYLLVATTTVLTQVVASVPLLWMIPLALYLITFIIAFSGWGRSIFIPLLVLGAGHAAYMYTTGDYYDLVSKVSWYLALLFLCGLLCHARLYHIRPETRRLPFFYLLLSAGGMIGALVASIGAPLLFDGFWEFPFGIALTVAFAGAILSEQFFPRILSADKIILARILFVCGIIVLSVNLIAAEDDGTASLSSRNFYGPAQVQFYEAATVLMHGGTLHGSQPTAKEFQYLPTSYYVSSSGVGRAMLYEQDARKDRDVRVGIIGLGTAALASYCRDGDSFVFYEIDPRIERIARTYFSYLSHCAGSEVRLGDGRLVLQSEERAGKLGEYDLIVVDAFSDDTIPVHLLTIQAVGLYEKHLRDKEGIIAIHVSNRYLDLAPIVLRIAAQLRMDAMVITDSGDSSEYGSATRWVLLTRSPKAFTATVFAGAGSRLPDISKTPVWTDDYTSIFTIVDIPLPWEK